MNVGRAQLHRERWNTLLAAEGEGEFLQHRTPLRAGPLPAQTGAGGKGLQAPRPPECDACPPCVVLAAAAASPLIDG